MSRKIILVGYPGSQKIVAASQYLAQKYLLGNGLDFELRYFNYKGPVDGWSRYVAGILDAIKDMYVIFSLDDYLIYQAIDKHIYFQALRLIEDVDCVKLCCSTPDEHSEYPVTTQYCLWNREFLIDLLSHPDIKTPWEFEIKGSAVFKSQKRSVQLRTCIHYFTNSSISSRWEGVRLDELNEEDLTHLKSNGLI